MRTSFSVQDDQTPLDRRGIGKPSCVPIHLEIEGLPKSVGFCLASQTNASEVFRKKNVLGSLRGVQGAKKTAPICSLNARLPES